MGPFKVRPGSRYPAGARADSEGINFCIFSQHATGAELLLYAKPTSKTPCQIITLDRDHNWTFFFWHVYVEGLKPGVCYTWRIDGPNDTQQSGCRFNNSSVTSSIRFDVTIQALNSFFRCVTSTNGRKSYHPLIALRFKIAHWCS